MRKGKKCFSAALSHSTLSPSLPTGCLSHDQAQPCDRLASSRKLGTQRSAFVGCGTRSPSEFVTSLCALCREGQSPQTSQRTRKIQSWNMPNWSVWSTSTLKLVNACSDFGAEQWVMAMHHGMLQNSTMTGNSMRRSNCMTSRRFRAVM